MSTSLGVLLVAGRVGKVNDLYTFDSGVKSLTFTVATAEYDGKTKQDVTYWHEVQVTGKDAEYLGGEKDNAPALKSGDIVVAFGNLTERSWSGDNGDVTVRVIRAGFNGVRVLHRKGSDSGEASPKPTKPRKTVVEEDDLDEIPF